MQLTLLQRKKQPLKAHNVYNGATVADMDRIRQVINETATPSHINSVPNNFGDARAGTLKADEWRTLMTIYIPIALISLWGTGVVAGTPQTQATFLEVLDHTMHLVSAVWLVCKRTTTRTRATSYRDHLISYVRNLRRLHLHSNFRPNHHAAFHIYDFLLLFGPVRSWWCFAFERLIGQLQRLPNNHKFGKSSFALPKESLIIISGQMEATIHNAYIKAGRLRQWLHKPACPEIIKECKNLLEKTTAPKVQDDEEWGEIFLHKGRSRATPSDLRPLVGTDEIVLLPSLAIDGVRYSSSSRHLGNSLICFYPNGDRTAALILGSIKYIYRKGGSTFLVIQRQLPRPSDDDRPDPFARYPDFPARLYQAQVSRALEEVRVDWVLCHYARWNASAELAVVLMLIKVNFVFFFFRPCMFNTCSSRTNPLLKYCAPVLYITECDNFGFVRWGIA